MSEFWDIVHMLICRNRYELIDRMEFADGFERRAKLDPFRNKKSK